MTVSRGIQAKKRPPATAGCLQCGENFTRRYSIMFNTDGTRKTKFCSTSCATKNRNPVPYFECGTCKKVGPRRKSNHAYDYSQKYCSRECQHKSLNKGGYLEKNGYRIVQIDGKAIPEHRHVMQKRIGRELFAEETVHHKDGNRTNNDPSNLELWSGRHGKGQRVEDKIEFCQQFLRDYGYAREGIGMGGPC